MGEMDSTCRILIKDVFGLFCTSVGFPDFQPHPAGIAGATGADWHACRACRASAEGHPYTGMSFLPERLAPPPTVYPPTQADQGARYITRCAWFVTATAARAN